MESLKADNTPLQDLFEKQTNINPDMQSFANKIGAIIINLNLIEDLPKICRERRKYGLVFDFKKTHCESYWQYKGALFQLHKEHIKASMMGLTKSDVCETIRKRLVISMQYG